jgi:peptidoglycan hydrolase FlgJ
MVNGADLTGKVAFDANSLNQLKQAAKENSPEALKAVAKQFESIMMNMMMKSMREASPQDGVFDNEQSKMFTSMLDQQLSSNLSAKGLGLADVLVRQLSKSTQTAMDNVGQALEQVPAAANELVDSLIAPHVSNPSDKKTNPALPSSNVEKPAKSSITERVSEGVSGFLKEMVQHAKAAARSTGMPTHLMLGQAALETGWGKKEIKAADGTPSFNLFGIKATGNWQGKVVEATTTEYINGVKQKRIEKFRAYDSYADSFKDFANMMKNNPRYQKVVASVNNVEHYAQAMQSAGYATDPAYAKKLASVIQKVMSS